MNKKVLDGTVTLLLGMSLIAASNIQEQKTGEPLPEPASRQKEWNRSVTAGVSRVLSEHSFTTESDEKTDIEKREVIMVTSPAWVLTDEFSTEDFSAEEFSAGELSEDLSADKFSAEEEAVLPAGLAQPASAGRAAAVKPSEIIEVETVIAAAWPDVVRPELAQAVPSGISTSMREVVAVSGQMAQALAEEIRAAQVVEEPVAGNRWGISLTQQEIDLLARIVWLEAGGEPVEGQEAVVEVIFNRIASDLYPDTLYDVLSQKNPVQFCSWKSRESAKPTEKEYRSIEQVLSGNTSILRNDTLYFSRKALTPRLDQRIGGHSFCY